MSGFLINRLPVTVAGGSIVGWHGPILQSTSSNGSTSLVAVQGRGSVNSVSVSVIGGFVSASIPAAQGYSSAGTMVASASGSSSFYSLPAERSTIFQPGVTYNGGIPSDEWTVHSTVNPTNTTADYAAVQNAVDAAHAAYPNGAVVQLGSGTFNFNNGALTLPSYTCIRGASTSGTLITCTNGATWNSYNPGTRGGTPMLIRTVGTRGSSINLAQNTVKGEYTCNVATTGGLAVGTLVLFDQLQACSYQADPCSLNPIYASADWSVVVWNHNPGMGGDDEQDVVADYARSQRPQSEVKRITAISGTAGNYTVTFETPFHMSYVTAKTAQITPYSSTTMYAGVEKLTVSFGGDSNIWFENSAYCWVKNVDCTAWLGNGVRYDGCYRCETRDSYIHDGVWPVPGGGGYCHCWQDGTAESLLENSITFSACKNLVARAGGAGCVAGYNYFDAAYNGGDPGWMECGMNASHLVGPHHVLFEGNYAFNFDSDRTHGNSTHVTVFRNWLRGIRRPYVDTTTGQTENDVVNDAGPKRCLGTQAYGYWFNAVGNVLGASGAMAGFVYQSPPSSGSNAWIWDSAIWALGWNDYGASGGGITVDWNVASGSRRMYRDGNWDWLQSQQTWHDSASATLPDSLYLASKPGFFGSNTWPWVNPINGNCGSVSDPQSYTIGTPPSDTLPALKRFLAGTPNVVP